MLQPECTFHPSKPHFDKSYGRKPRDKIILYFVILKTRITIALGFTCNIFINALIIHFLAKSYFFSKLIICQNIVCPE